MFIVAITISGLKLGFMVTLINVATPLPVNIYNRLCTLILYVIHSGSANEFLCEHGALCVYNGWICDGDNDCGDYSDERGCNGKCHFLHTI